ncbi:MAG TPA: amidohydrolase family protein [Bryobacteraceae bacterium]|jgi:imidazolonepropionase-like amidohydrolase
MAAFDLVLIGEPMNLRTLALLSLIPAILTAQADPPILVKAARLLDVRKGVYISNAAIWIDGTRIKEVGAASAMHAPQNVRIIDLGNATLLPGLIDSHTDLMARMASSADGYTLSLATKSQAFRALEGAYNARITLHAGFTSVRDVESEGSGYSDVALRDAIEQGIAEGPRMQVATRGIAAVGQYNPFGVSPDLEGFPTGAQMVSGVEDTRRAVREQIGHGANLIKVYADWRYPTLTVDEIRVVVEEAHKQKLKVACHATTAEGIGNALAAGVDSIEHGNGVTREQLQLMKAKGTFLVPTVGAVYSMVERQRNAQLTAEQRQRMETFVKVMRQSLQDAISAGVKIASGFDASGPPGQGNNAHELSSLAALGMAPPDVIRAATLRGAELMGWQDDIGALEAGKYADIIAVDGDPLADIKSLQNVKFVMKGGTIIRPLPNPR